MGETLSNTPREPVSGRPPPDPLAAQLYAALHSGNAGDVAFYRRACEGAARVLELGSGAGRIGLAVAQTGASVTGIELNSGLLALSLERAEALRKRTDAPLRLHFEQGDMTTFVRKNSFERVLIPYSALWCLQGTETKARCLRNAWECLTEGGQLVLDVYDADVWAPHEGDGADEHHAVGALDAFEELPSVLVQGEHYRVWERNRWDTAAREMYVEYRLCPLVPSGPGGLVLETLPVWRLDLNHSVLWRHELAELLDDCGFEVEWGTDDEDEGTDFAEQVVLRAFKD